VTVTCLSEPVYLPSHGHRSSTSNAGDAEYRDWASARLRVTGRRPGAGLQQCRPSHESRAPADSRADWQELRHEGKDSDSDSESEEGLRAGKLDSRRLGPEASLAAGPEPGVGRNQSRPRAHRSESDGHSQLEVSESSCFQVALSQDKHLLRLPCRPLTRTPGPAEIMMAAGLSRSSGFPGRPMMDLRY
jgi:hypothetical protein